MNIRAPQPRKPRFNPGDPVIVTGPSVYRNRRGFVAEVIEPRAGDFVYRYRVRFSDSSSETFFGFELQSEDSAADRLSA